MKKPKDFSKYGSPAHSSGTNFRIKLTIGKTLDRATIQDGAGFASSQAEAERRYRSILDRTCDVLKAELYFENQLIKKR